MGLAVNPTTGGGIITLSSATVASLLFAASSIVTYDGAYSLIVTAGFGSSFTTTVASAAMTYTYINPCKTATIKAGYHFNPISVNVGSTTTSGPSLWYDSVSGSAASTLCGPLNWSFNSSSTYPAAFVSSTMSSIFVITTTSTHAIMAVSPTLKAEVGSYALIFNVCLTDYSTQCA